MCAKNKSWQKIIPTPPSPDPTGSGTQTRRSHRSRSAVQEEMRFAGWFWRSASEDFKSRSRPLWVYILVLNSVIALILQFQIGFAPALGIFLIIQCITTLLLFPNIRKKINRTLRKPTLQSSGNHQVYPLADVEFFLNPTQDIILMSHKGGNSATALLVVDKVPVGIRGNMFTFIRAIYSAGVPLFYTLVHAPVSHDSLPNLNAITESAQNTLTNLDPSEQATFAWRRGGLWKTRLILGTRRDISTLNGDHTDEVLTNQVEHDLQTLQIAFRTAYPHIRLRRLTGTQLEDGVRSILLQGKPPHFF